MHFYTQLFSQSWQICSAWVASYSLVSKIVFGVLFASSGVVAESFLWPNETEMSSRIARLLVSAVVGPTAVVAAMFLISFFYYAPYAVLEQSAATAASNSRAMCERRGQAERVKLSKAVVELQAQIRTLPCSQELIRARRERDAAIQRSEETENFASRLVDAADALDEARKGFEDAVAKQRREWQILTGLSMAEYAKPGVSMSDMLTEVHQYDRLRMETEAAVAKIHEKGEALHALRLDR